MYSKWRFPNLITWQHSNGYGQVDSYFQNTKFISNNKNVLFININTLNAILNLK